MWLGGFLFINNILNKFKKVNREIIIFFIFFDFNLSGAGLGASAVDAVRAPGDPSGMG